MTVLKTTSDLLSINCYLSDDLQKLYLDIELKKRPAEDAIPDDFETVIEAELCDMLEQKIDPERVDIGVLRDAITKLLAGEPVKRRLISRGKPCGKARDGKIVFLVRRLSKDKKVEVDEKGFANFREVHLFDNIEKGQVVARVYPPKQGSDGESALGEAIPGPIGRDASLSTDQSLKIIPPDDSGKAYSKIVSCQEGYLFEDQTRLAVHSELSISGDVDFTTGNIDFIGAVAIRGNVKPGFIVRGKTGVQIGGNVTGATISSSEGDVSIGGTVIGTSGGAITAGGSVEIMTAQDARIDAEMSIIVNKSSLGSTLRSQSTIHIPNGSLIGGEAFTVCGIEAAELGNNTGATTRIYLCSDVETTPVYRTLFSSIERHTQAIDTLKMHLGPLAKNPRRIQFLNPEIRKNMEVLLTKLNKIQKSLAEKKLQQKDLLSKASASNLVRVNFHKRLHPGVQIVFYDSLFEPNESVTGPASLELAADRSELKTSELLPLECAMKSATLEKDIHHE